MPWPLINRYLFQIFIVIFSNENVIVFRHAVKNMNNFSLDCVSNTLIVSKISEKISDFSDFEKYLKKL